MEKGGGTAIDGGTTLKWSSLLLLTREPKYDYKWKCATHTHNTHQAIRAGIHLCCEHHLVLTMQDEGMSQTKCIPLKHLEQMGDTSLAVTAPAQGQGGGQPSI